MNKEQSILQKELSNLPTQLEFLEVVNHRGKDFYTKEKALYKSLKAGFDGQEKLVFYLEKYGQSHWTILQNVWLDYFGTFESDLILITNHSIYVFEIKNYSGTFIYDEGKCYYNKFETSINPVEQARVCMVNLKNMLSKKYRNIQVKSAVIFTGDDNDIQIKSHVQDIDIINRTQILNYIRQIADEEKSSRTHRITADDLIRSLAPYEIPNPYSLAPLTDEELSHIIGGIYCTNCLSYDVKTLKLWITCSCGFHEPRDEAIIRTICDYGVLTYGKNLKRIELEKFIGEDNSISYLKKILYDHFDANQNFSGTTYVNKNLLYSRIHHQFTIDRQQIFKPNENQIIYLQNNQVYNLP